ncbi:hypothetical protein ZWY2020_004472 [Hordeum vulgare]|nr:hypothetical protein ZWY2020_004472 [Hordeum vulgare]
MFCPLFFVLRVGRRALEGVGGAAGAQWCEGVGLVNEVRLSSDGSELGRELGRLGSELPVGWLRCEETPIVIVNRLLKSIFDRCILQTSIRSATDSRGIRLLESIFGRCILQTSIRSATDSRGIS